MIGTIGGVTYPTAASVAGDTLTALDPVRSAIAGLLAAAINGELGAPWGRVTALLPVGHALRGSNPIQDILELEPDAQTLATRRVGYPLLCVYRQGRAAWSRRNPRQWVRVQQWNADIILGPIAIDEVRKLGDMLTAAASVCAQVLTHGCYPGHPSASPPVAAYGTGQPWAVPVSQIGVIGQIGPGWAKVDALGGDARPYYGITIQIETHEVTELVIDPTTDAVIPHDNTELGATDLTIGLVVDPIDGATIEDFVVVGPPDP